MKPLTVIMFFAILTVISFAGLWAFKVAITMIQIIMILGLVMIMLFSGMGYLIYIKLQDRPPTSSEAKRALEFAKKWWLDYAHEHIDIKTEGRGGVGQIPGSGEKFYGWLFYRLDGPKMEQSLILIVHTNPLDYAWHDAEPEPEDIDDPFKKFFAEYSRAPTSKISPESMPEYWKYRRGTPQTVVKVGDTTKKTEEDEFIKRKKEEE